MGPHAIESHRGQSKGAAPNQRRKSLQNEERGVQTKSRGGMNMTYNQSQRTPQRLKIYKTRLYCRNRQDHITQINLKDLQTLI
jgi:hypothetical protein